MLSWADFGAEVPHLEAFGRRRLERRIAYLATIRADGSPRVHPVSPFIGGGCLAIYMEPTSPKVADLRRDARYALHCGVEDNEGGESEFYVTGRAEEITDAQKRIGAVSWAEGAGYDPVDRHVFFEFKLGHVLATTYDEGPKRERWRAGANGHSR
ncbi:MAG: pyridoxamine 5'-phosphate oxidase [Rhodospirillales bacterium]|nr:pyridoxamine 5'-phosphate oxidase [Rhodospirillales bacterium]